MIAVIFPRISPAFANDFIWCGCIDTLLTNFSIEEIFDLTKIIIKLFESIPYLAGVIAAELRW